MLEDIARPNQANNAANVDGHESICGSLEDGRCDTDLGRAFELGRKVIEFQGTAILGFSLMNSWFRSRENLTGLIDWAAHNFKQIKLFIPDIFAEHNLMALGYELTKAREKARLEGNNLFNRCARVCGDLQLDGVEVERIDLKDITACRAEYLISRSWIYDLYLANEEFRRDARDLTAKFLQGKREAAGMIREAAAGATQEIAINQAVHFLLEELSFLMASPRIIGDQLCAYVYHHDMPILRKLIDGEYGKLPQSLDSFPGFVIYPG